jgi:hypothetical protein
MRVSGYNNHYEFVMSAGAKAKSVTNNLPILSVLGGRSILLMINLIRIQNIKRLTLVCTYRNFDTLT